MEQKKSKLTKIGQVWSTKADPDKFFMKLGNKGKNTQYDLSVEVTVKDSTGKVIATQTDGILSLSDPRKSPYANEESLSKVPNLQFDILLAQQD